MYPPSPFPGTLLGLSPEFSAQIQALSRAKGNTVSSSGIAAGTNPTPPVSIGQAGSDYTYVTSLEAGCPAWFHVQATASDPPSAAGSTIPPPFNLAFFWTYPGGAQGSGRISSDASGASLYIHGTNVHVFLCGLQASGASSARNFSVSISCVPGPIPSDNIYVERFTSLAAGGSTTFTVPPLAKEVEVFSDAGTTTNLTLAQLDTTSAAIDQVNGPSGKIPLGGYTVQLRLTNTGVAAQSGTVKYRINAF